jgi:hypothetical protein
MSQVQAATRQGKQSTSPPSRRHPGKKEYSDSDFCLVRRAAPRVLGMRTPRRALQPRRVTRAAGYPRRLRVIGLLPDGARRG